MDWMMDGLIDGWMMDWLMNDVLMNGGLIDEWWIDCGLVDEWWIDEWRLNHMHKGMNQVIKIEMKKW